MDSIWLLYFSQVQSSESPSGPFLPYLLVPLSFFFRVDYFQRDVCRAQCRGQGTVAIMCVCVLAACYFKIPFEGLDHYPRVSKQGKVEFDRLVLSPPSLPLYRVGIWPNLQKPRTLGFPLLTQLDHDDRCYPLLLILEILFFSKSIRCFWFWWPKVCLCDWNDGTWPHEQPGVFGGCEPGFWAARSLYYLYWGPVIAKLLRWRPPRMNYINMGRFGNMWKIYLKWSLVAKFLVFFGKFAWGQTFQPLCQIPWPNLHDLVSQARQGSSDSTSVGSVMCCCCLHIDAFSLNEYDSDSMEI